MAVIGMIGGLGPESTLDYYKMLIEKHRKITGVDRNPEILIYSLDVYRLLDLFAQGRTEDVAELLTAGVNALHKAGADFAFISANTPHIVMDKVRVGAPIPLISIVEETCKVVETRGIRRIGFLGTRFSMQNDFYQKEFNKGRIRFVVPSSEDQEYIQHKLMTEIELGIFTDETRQGLLDIIEGMIRQDEIEGVVLGCTELPLILTQDAFGIPFFNTSEIHVDSVLRYYLDLVKE